MFSVDFPTLNSSDFLFDSVPPAHSLWLTRWPEIKSLWGHEREISKLAKGKNWFASGDDFGNVFHLE